MPEPVIDTLDVPGARLHLETRGSGPLLLFVVGGNGDSAIYGGVAAALADRFTVEANMTFWMEHELRQYPRYVPDLDALGAARDRIVPAGGQESRGHMPYRPNLVLAERLGLQVVDFVGDHVGYATHPTEFASQLGALLTGSGSVRPGR